MTIKLVPTTSPPNPNSQPKSSLAPIENQKRSAAPSYVMVQLALKIELPTNDVDNFKSSGAIVISLTPV